jgi:hypothetical protein
MICLAFNLRNTITDSWKQYYRDLAALKEQGDPDGSEAAELPNRHRNLVAALTGNNPEIEEGLTALYRDWDWPADMKDRMSEYEKLPS